MGNKEIKQLLEQLPRSLVMQIAVGKRSSIDTPSLSTSPGRSVAVSLCRHAPQWLASLLVEEIGMVGGVVGTHHQRQGGMQVGNCDIGIVGIARLFRCPEQQRQVQQAVDDQAIVVGGSQRTPCLDELPIGLEPAYQIVSCQQGSCAPLLVVVELVGSHA